MAKKNQDMLSQLTEAGSASIDLINRLDEATGKFQPGKRKGSIIKAAQGNVFEFPVFISNSIPIDYATATTSLIEQLYASFLQMAISINPVIDADSVKNGLQFANLMTNTNKYLEYTEMDYAHDACHAVYQESGYNFELMNDSIINHYLNSHTSLLKQIKNHMIIMHQRFQFLKLIHKQMRLPAKLQKIQMVNYNTCLLEILITICQVSNTRIKTEILQMLLVVG